MARKYLVTEDEFLSAKVSNDGNLMFTRDNGEVLVAGPVTGDAFPALLAARDETITARDAAQAARDQAEAFAGNAVGFQDEAVASLIDADSATKTALSATFVGAKGANVARFIKRAQAGEDLKIVALGDSVLEGTTVTDPATDGTVALLAHDLTERFDGTFTAVNKAVSGYTTAASFIRSRVRDALQEKGDLYVIAFGKNDLAWDRYSSATRPVPGYPLESSMAMLELMFRLIRSNVPAADIMLVAENPYSPLGQDSNVKLVTWTEHARRVAATYGVEFVDAYSPFAALTPSGLADVVPDGTHPNTAGHRMMADTILGHLPVAYGGPSIATGAVPDTGIFEPERIDTSTPYGSGWSVIGQPTTIPVEGLTWVNTGSGWSGTTPAVTSNVGDYAEFVFTGSELLLEMSTATSDDLRATVTVDGVPLYTNRAFTNGKTGSAYLVPIVTGLDITAQHTVRVTVTSGTLRISMAAALKGKTSSFIPSVVTVDLGSSTTAVALPTDGSIQYVINNANAVPLPAGWGSMDVTFTGYMVLRVVSATTTERLLNGTLRIDLEIAELLQVTQPPRESGFGYSPLTFAYTATDKSAAVGVRFEARVQSADKDGCDRASWALQAVCHRRS